MPSSGIYRSDLDGRNRTILGRFHLTFVSGLTLDVVRRRIYIADQHKHSIESMNYVGMDRYTIINNEVRFEHFKFYKTLSHNPLIYFSLPFYCDKNALNV
jgi:hypothetical protein